MEVAARTRYEYMHFLGLLRRANLQQQPMHWSEARCPEVTLAQPSLAVHAHAVRVWHMPAPCSYLGTRRHLNVEGEKAKRTNRKQETLQMGWMNLSLFIDGGDLHQPPCSSSRGKAREPQHQAPLLQYPAVAI